MHSSIKKVGRLKSDHAWSQIQNHKNRRTVSVLCNNIQAVVERTPGTKIIECWRYPDYFSSCKKGMSVNQLRQIQKYLDWV